MNAFHATSVRIHFVAVGAMRENACGFALWKLTFRPNALGDGTGVTAASGAGAAFCPCVMTVWGSEEPLPPPPPHPVKSAAAPSKKLVREVIIPHRGASRPRVQEHSDGRFLA